MAASQSLIYYRFFYFFIPFFLNFAFVVFVLTFRNE